MANNNEVSAIRAAIKDSGLEWQPAGNFLVELSQSEREKYLGFVPGPGEASLVERESISKANLASFLSFRASGDAYGAPASIDWRSKGGGNYVTAVKNQGACGSCVAFGTVTTVESAIRIARGAAYAVDLSEAHLFYCIARAQGRTCGNGWYPEAAMIAFKDIGVADEACYPYVAGDQNCTGRCADWASRVTKISGYTRLTSIAAIKDWISTKGPVQACFSVYNDFFSYSTGVYRKTANATLSGGHCVCIVGYNDAQSCWICKNSWGTGWGEAGFFRIAYGECGIDSTVYGANSVVDTRWVRGTKVRGLWAINEDKNAWVYLNGEGWKKISNSTEDGLLNMLRQLSVAKAVNANVDVYLDNGMITILYVF
jgi:C1A family cysteine protease